LSAKQLSNWETGSFTKYKKYTGVPKSENGSRDQSHTRFSVNFWSEGTNRLL